MNGIALEFKTKYFHHGQLDIGAIAPSAEDEQTSPEHVRYSYLFRSVPVTRPNQGWAADITYIPMARGFVYLVAVMDGYSRRVLPWRRSITLESDFCVSALQEALQRFAQPQIFNTDRGSAFTIVNSAIERPSPDISA